jgi:hypothetical protein
MRRCGTPGSPVWGRSGRAKGGIYKTVTTVWVSPDRTTRVLVIGGTVAALKARRTMLTTRTLDGRKLITTDEFGSRDLTGNTDRQIVLNAHFPELWQRHQLRISELDQIVPLFDSEDVAGQLADDARQHAERLVEMGYARFGNPSPTFWRHSWTGALAVWLSAIAQGFSEARSQQGRSQLSRPGA